MRGGGRALGVAIAAVLTSGLAAAAVGDDVDPVLATEPAAPAPRPTLPIETTDAPAPEPTTTTVAPTTTTSAPPPPPPTTVPPPPPPLPPTPDPAITAAAAATAGRDLTPYLGLGAWIDAYDWTAKHNRGGTPVGPADVDAMAAAGVQTLYVQAARWDTFGYVMEPERLTPIVERARARGMSVVGWYLPTLEDVGLDLRRIVEVARFPGIDSVAVDIESRVIGDVEERNRRLIELSRAVRASLPDEAVGAIPFPPVVMEVVNPNFWPGFPWRELAPLYDVWLPMSYQSDRKESSGYRDAYRYTAENIDRMRANLGQPGAAVHSIGGIADKTSEQDVADMLRACVERLCIGGSLYDWRTTGSQLWGPQQGFRAAR